MKLYRIFFYIFIFSISFNSIAYGNKKPEKEKFIKTTLFSYENDSVYGPDKYYTNGLQILFISKNIETSEENKYLSKFLNIQNKSFHNYSFGVGQKIYTPSTIEEEKPSLNDRPYAGYLYFFLNKNIVHNNKTDTIGLSLGITGPASLGEQTQKSVHDLIGSPKPQGWDNQLSNELLFMLSIMRTEEYHNPKPFAYDWKILSKFGGNLGTPFTDIFTDVEFRYGWNLDKDIILNKIQSLSPGIIKNPRNGDFKDISYYAFASAGIKTSFYNTFLYGNLSGDKPDISPYGIIFELTTGLTLRIKNFYVKYSNIFTTKEFKEQDKPQLIFLLTGGFLF